MTGSRPTLALVDAAPNSYDSGPMPSKSRISWGVGSKPARQDGQRGRRNGGAVSLGTLPAGTTEAHVDDMMMVLGVAGKATPAPKPA